MARKTIRRNGRMITIDTETGKEIKPGTAAWKAAGGLYSRLQNLPGDMAIQAKFAAKDIRDNVTYSDKLDKKGRLQTSAQERVRRETADKNRKTGQKATLNGKPVVWKGGKWVPAPATSKKMANIPPAEAKPGSPSYVRPKTDKKSSNKASPPTNKKPAPPTPRPTPSPPTDKKPAAPKKKTAANDSRNAAYIAARKKLNSNSTKAERDKVRDLGLKISKGIHRNKSKNKPRAATAKNANDRFRR